VLGRAHPYHVVPQIDPKTGRWLLIAKGEVPDEPVPLDIGVVAGDFAHNLRSALNYLVWQLATPPVGTGPGNDTQFPIFFDHPPRVYKLPPADRFRSSQNRFLAGVRDPHRAFIERLQPYHGGHRSNLELLAILNDLDKHRVISGRAVHAGLRPIFAGFGDVLIEYSPFPALYDGAELARLLVVRPDPGQQVGVNLKPVFSVGFGDASLTGSLGALGNMTRYVELILRAFRDVF